MPDVQDWRILKQTARRRVYRADAKPPVGLGA